MNQCGRVSSVGARERDHLETAQAALVGLLTAVDEIDLRIKHAIRRSHLVESVLQPAIQRLDEVRAELRLVRTEIDQAWEEGQARKWRQDERTE